MWKTNDKLAREQFDPWSGKYDWDGKVTNVPVGRLLHMGLDEPGSVCGKHNGGCEQHIQKLRADIDAGKLTHPILAYEDKKQPRIFYFPRRKPPHRCGYPCGRRP